MSMTAVYKETATGNTGPSPEIWGGIDIARIKAGDIGYGYMFEDDFLSSHIPNPTLTTQVAYANGYKAFASSGGSIACTTSINSTETAGGIIDLTTDTAGEACLLAQSGNPFRIRGTTAGKKLAFEARIAITQIVTNDAQYFIGLGETDAMTLSVTVPLADADACEGSGSMIGFSRTEDGLGVLKTVYADRAATWTSIDATAGTIAALTWTKIGGFYDPERTNQYGDNLWFYQDGVMLDTGLTNAEIAALTYLDANNLGLLAGLYTDSAGTASHLYMDWWRCAQLR
jgi:hypothetical protein